MLEQEKILNYFGNLREQEEKKVIKHPGVQKILFLILFLIMCLRSVGCDFALKYTQGRRRTNCNDITVRVKNWTITDKWKG